MMSTADSQSISLMQAYASGMPAVCARARGLPDYTPPQCGILVEPGDVGGATEALRRLLGDEALRQRMGQAGMEFVKQFAPAAITERWEKIYAEVSQNFRRTKEVKK
jgi:glycosyltransferase involved in cell wall biosynthesis